MIRKQYILDLHEELIIDNFAGGGGASTGIEMALSRHVDHAINHDHSALGMHRINHPQTVHHCEDVFDIDPRAITNGRPVGLAHFSPDCKHFSKAKGGKPLSKKIRGLVLVMLRWAKAVRPRVMTMENVEEIVTWGPLGNDGRPDPVNKGRTWQAFISILGNGIDPSHPDLPEILSVVGDIVTKSDCIAGFGYSLDCREIRASDYGAPTIRKRLFLIARCDGKPIIWPKESHGHDKELKPYRTIAECLDWSLPCPSIFLNRHQAKLAKCRRPLAPSTLRRIATGIDRYVLKAKRPFLVSVTHQRGDRTIAPIITEHANASHQRNFPVDEPGRTQCAEVKGGHFAVVPVSLVQIGYGERAGQRPRVNDLESPLGTVVSSAGKHAITAASMVKLRGDNVGSSLNEPCHTVSAGGTHHGMVCAYLAQHNGGFNTTPGHPADSPISTINSSGSQQAVVAASVAAYYGNDKDGQSINESARTVTTKERFGFIESLGVKNLTLEQIERAKRVTEFLRNHGVAVEGDFTTVCGYIIIDIGMRMLTPRELYRAQGFPESYIIDKAWIVDPQSGKIVERPLTKEEQIRMCGNSVSPPPYAAIVSANVPELRGWTKEQINPTGISKWTIG